MQASILSGPQARRAGSAPRRLEAPSPSQTIVCHGGYAATITNAYFFMSQPQGELNADGLGWSAGHQPFHSSQVTRP